MPTTLAPQPASQVTARWHTDVDAAPPDTQRPPHPSRTRAWAKAWQQVTTERVLSHQHVHLFDETAGISETVSYYHVDPGGSPYWNSQETDAAMAPVWPGPVLWAGSPHAEYGGAGTSTSPLARAAISAGQDLAAQYGACAVAFPGLTTAQAALLSEAGPDTPLNIATDVAFTRPLGNDLDSWWAGIPTRYRREARRQWRRGTEAGLLLRPLTGTSIRAALGTFTDLANGTADRHGTHLYGHEMLYHLTDVPGAVLLAATHDQHLVGGLYGWLHHDCLYLWASGIDYSHPAARWTYTWLMGEAARWAIDHHATRIDAGRWNCRAKTHLGYQPQILRTVVSFTQPNQTAAAALTRLSSRLEVSATPYLTSGIRW
ncbi:GNAT family N-acetyltransferase [Streptomyces sp. NPDC001933]|uniref:GNAT family N-acetyltransferase n=1 Tax=Streptomyces sp. NPDC001933 TaxID=3364626 RepID=UPI0036C25096